MNREQLEAILPHRGRMLLLDEASVENDAAHGSYTVRGDEWFLDGHFPGNPIVPGVVLCEILAQSVCVLMRDAMEPGKTPLYTGLSNVRFRSMVKPGDVFESECRITRSRPPFFFAAGTGRVGDRVAVTAEFSFAVMGE